MLYVMALYPLVTKDDKIVIVPRQGFCIITTLVAYIYF